MEKAQKAVKEVHVTLLSFNEKIIIQDKFISQDLALVIKGFSCTFRQYIYRNPLYGVKIFQQFCKLLARKIIDGMEI